MKQSDSFFRKTVDLLSIGYNKSVVLSRITRSALKIIVNTIRKIQNELEYIVTSFEEIRATSESTSSNTRNIYSTMNEIIDSTTTVNKAIESNVVLIQEAAEESTRINDLIDDLEEKSVSVRSMTEEIDDVAQQTNILAINASIEAARAGNAGRGFHIIAKEIRKLSEQTQNFATSISSTINDFNSGLFQVQKNFDQLNSLLLNLRKDLLETSSTFGTNEKRLQDSGYRLAEINGAVSEQTEAMTEGLASLEKVFSLLKDANSIATALDRSHSSIDELFDKKQ